MGTMAGTEKGMATVNSTIDTVELAKVEREKQGQWEVEVSYGGEADLHKLKGVCAKNAGHLQFIPVDNFTVNCLPPGCHDNDLLDLVRAMSDITVRVSVKYVSTERPETFPQTNKTYPCYKNRGSDMMRVGTGWLSDVFKYPVDYDRNNETCECLSCESDRCPSSPELGECNSDISTPEKCECHECLASPTPKTQFAHIHIRTATHVVYDNQEGAHTTCHLFFDRGNMPRFCSGVVTLRGMLSVWGIVDRDECTMRFITHDLELADRLHVMMCHAKEVTMRVMDKFDRFELEKQKSPSQVENMFDSWNKLTIIVSHPHGCSKQVTVGYCTNTDDDVEEINSDWTQYTYTTPTCPGSSGASVLMMGRQWWHLNDLHTHGGNCEGNKALNFSCHGMD